MTEQQKEWYRAAVLRWDPLKAEIAAAGEQLPLIEIKPDEVCDLAGLRSQAAKFFAALTAAVAAELIQGWFYSIHHRWIREVQELIEQDDFYLTECFNEAESLRTNLRKHGIYDRERRAVRQIADLLEDFAGTQREAFEKELEIYRDMMLRDGR